MKGVLSRALSVGYFCFLVCGLVVTLPPACSQLSVFTSDYIAPAWRDFISQPGNVILLQVVAVVAGFGVFFRLLASQSRGA